MHVVTETQKLPKQSTVQESEDSFWFAICSCDLSYKTKQQKAGRKTNQTLLYMMRCFKEMTHGWGGMAWSLSGPELWSLCLHPGATKHMKKNNGGHDTVCLGAWLLTCWIFFFYEFNESLSEPSKLLNPEEAKINCLWFTRWHKLTKLKSVSGSWKNKTPVINLWVKV